MFFGVYTHPHHSPRMTPHSSGVYPHSHHSPRMSPHFSPLPSPPPHFPPFLRVCVFWRVHPSLSICFFFREGGGGVWEGGGLLPPSLVAPPLTILPSPSPLSFPGLLFWRVCVFWRVRTFPPLTSNATSLLSLPSHSCSLLCVAHMPLTPPSLPVSSSLPFFECHLTPLPSPHILVHSSA